MIKWEAIDTVLLDMDGTLLDLHFDNYFWLEHLPRRYADIRGLSIEQVRTQLISTYDGMRGTLDWYCLDYWTRTLGVDLVELKQEIAHKICLRPGAVAFLDWLTRCGKRTLLITNAHPRSLHLKMQRVPIAHHFEALVTSHQFQVPKERIEFWQALQNLHHFDPQRTLFIDDTETVLASAGNFGIQHLLGIVQPDMRGPLREPGRYPAFNHFDELTRLP